MTTRAKGIVYTYDSAYCTECGAESWKVSDLQHAESCPLYILHKLDSIESRLDKIEELLKLMVTRPDKEE